MLRAPLYILSLLLFFIFINPTSPFAEESKTKKIFQAIKNGEMDSIELFLEEKVINLNDDSSVLRIAVSYQQKEVIDLLLSHGANIEIVDNYGMTPLMRAAEIGSAEMLTLLLKKGADVDTEDEEGGLTALWYAQHHGHFEIAKILVENGAMPDLVTSKNFKITKFLLEQGADVNTVSTGMVTALTVASSADAVNLYLEYGADIHHCSFHGFPLSVAIDHDNIEVVQALLDHGADPTFSSVEDWCISALEFVEKLAKKRWFVKKEILDLLHIYEKTLEIEREIIDDILVDQNDLILLPPKNIRLLRNTVFAKYGRDFKSGDLKKWFKYKDWYSINGDYSDDLLNGVDKENIATILKAEKQQ